MDAQATTWYVVVEVKRSNHDVFPYLDYKGIVLMTTDKEEALAKEKELDSRGNGTVGIVEILRTMNA